MVCSIPLAINVSQHALRLTQCLNRNVNGIRNPFSYPPWNASRSFPAMFDILESDIVVMQELKIQRKDLRDDMVMLDGWDCYFSLPKHKKGYSGVGIYTRNATCAPIRAEEGLLGVLPSPSGTPYRDLPEAQSIGGYPSEFQIDGLGVDPALLDAEGRCLVLEFPAFVLFGVYSPANSNGLRDDFRYGFVCALDCRIRNLTRQGKRVVLVGDLNVSRHELDTASSADDMRRNGITHEDYISTPNRRIFNQLLVGGEVVGERDEGREQGVLWDTTRGFHPDRAGMYTHWEQKINARPGNFGSRIDFVLVASSMQSWIKDANIQEGLLGSDHCPVFADFHDVVEIDGKEVNLLDIMSPAGSFVGGQRQREWVLQDIPAFSGRRLQEFDKRRSIKSMFAAPKAKQTTTPSQQSTDDSKPSLEKKSEDCSLPLQSPPPTAPLNGSTNSSDKKRKASVSSKPVPAKKTKSGTAATSTASASVAKGQQSLRGFFQPKAAPPSKTDSDAALKIESGTETKDTQAIGDSTTPLSNVDQADSSATRNPSTPPSKSRESATPASAVSFTSPTASLSNFEARSATSASWSALLNSRPTAPKCEDHSEPCKTMQTKKKGSNQGRSFFMCARPLGPSGQKEKGTEWRCGTFIWCSDWQNGKGAAA
jgi:AP endonuclease-2